MKKHILFAAALVGSLLVAKPEANAQGAYLKLGGAYNFGVASEINYNETSVYTSMGTNSYETGNAERVNINYGKGIVAGGAIGYMFNQHLGAELGIGYLIGGKNNLKNSRNYNGAISSHESEVASRMLLLQPAFVITAGMEGINPYARFGMIAAKGSVTGTDIIKHDGEYIVQETKVSGGWGLGLQAGLGVEFKISDKMAFYSELTMNNLSYSPDKGEVTKATYNGADMLGELTTYDKEVEFVDDYSYNSNDRPSDSEPGKYEKFNMPFSAAGIGLGIKMNF